MIADPGLMVAVSGYIAADSGSVAADLGSAVADRGFEGAKCYFVCRITSAADPPFRNAPVRGGGWRCVGRRSGSEERAIQRLGVERPSFCGPRGAQWDWRSSRRSGGRSGRNRWRTAAVTPLSEAAGYCSLWVTAKAVSAPLRGFATALQDAAALLLGLTCALRSRTLP